MHSGVILILRGILRGWIIRGCRSCGGHHAATVGLDQQPPTTTARACEGVRWSQCRCTLITRACC